MGKINIDQFRNTSKELKKLLEKHHGEIDQESIYKLFNNIKKEKEILDRLEKFYKDGNKNDNQSEKKNKKNI